MLFYNHMQHCIVSNHRLKDKILSIYSYNMVLVRSFPDGAEICELVGLYIIHVYGEKYGKVKRGLYHGDGSACFGNINGSQAEQIRKELFQYLKLNLNLGLKVKRI